MYKHLERGSWVLLISRNEEIKHTRNWVLIRVLDEKDVRARDWTMYKMKERDKPVCQ